MNKTNTDFDKWFDTLAINVLERSAVEFRDRDSVKEEYEQGKNVYDVIDEIVAEYGEVD